MSQQTGSSENHRLKRMPAGRGYVIVPMEGSRLQPSIFLGTESFDFALKSCRFHFFYGTQPPENKSFATSQRAFRAFLLLEITHLDVAHIRCRWRKGLTHFERKNRTLKILPRKPTWQWTSHHLKMIFQCHVSFQVFSY